MLALKCVGVSKVFGRRAVLEDVTLTVAPGEIYGLVGRNGAGKSTLLKIIAGFLAPSAGSVEVCGEMLEPCQTSAHLGCLIEGPAVSPDLSAFQNVMLRAIAQGQPDPDAASIEALEAVRLNPKDTSRVRDYSLGMKQRLGVALALTGAPDVLLLDEPFNGLDPEGVQRLRRLLTAAAEERGVAVVVSSHVLDQLERTVTRYGVLREGQLVFEGTAEEVAEACADYVRVESPDATRALVVLERAFPEARFTVMPDSSIRVDASVTAEAVGRALMEARVSISGLGIHSCDIEEYFVGLMGAPSSDSALRDGSKGGHRG